LNAKHPDEATTDQKSKTKIDESKRDDGLNELKYLRMKKMAELLAKKRDAMLKKKLQENTEKMLSYKVNSVLSFLLRPDAYSYLMKIKEKNPKLYERIKAELLPPQIIHNIDRIIYVINAGRIPRGIISLINIQQIEREILGIKSTIKYKKRGEKERVDISALFKGEW
ncbi:MAG: hypothetical protein ACTSWN_01280, partial [Promethearchaeota archaeon]